MPRNLRAMFAEQHADGGGVHSSPPRGAAEGWRYRSGRYRILALCLLLSTLVPQISRAQYYNWGVAPASVRWRSIKTRDVKLIYPDDFEQNARRMMWYLDTMRTHVGWGYSHGTMRTPVIIQTHNMRGNGMSMWAPKRIEMLAAPGSSYSEPWLKQLAFHEFRHNVQYNNMRRSTARALTWLLGEQFAFVGVGQFSMFVLEGDATMAETELSAFGRGLQPSFTMHYRAVGDVGEGRRENGRKYSGDYWFCGSFRDFVPDHYRLGYQMVRWSYNHWGRFVWDDVANYVARNPQFIVPFNLGFRKHYHFTETKLFHNTFADLNAYWRSLPPTQNWSTRIYTPETSYTTYQWPLWLDAGTLVAFKSDFDRPSRIVRVDAETGHEKILAYTGAVSSRPVLAEGRLWWTEYRRSLLWAEKISSRLCSYDFASGRKRTHHDARQLLFPTALGGGRMAFVEYDPSGRFSITGEGAPRVDFPLDIEVTGLAWDDVTGALYFIGLDDGGMFLGAVDGACSAAGGWRRLTPSRHITISELRAGGGRLWFGSIVSGKDEAHCWDLATDTEYRVSTSTYGSFQPSTPAPNGEGERIALTTYDRHGYHLAVQQTSSATPQQQRTLPLDLVNPPWKRWDLPRMDSIVYTPAEAEKSRKDLKPRRFSRMLNIFRPHSWLPLNFYPPAAIEEADLTMSLGATVMSQSLLSDATTWLAYGWRPSGGSMLRGGASYSGLGVVLDVDFTWGGARDVSYTPIPADVKRRKHLSVNTRLSLPMVTSSGYWYSRLTPSVSYSYSNGLIFAPRPDGLSGTLTRGIDKLSFGVSYSGQTRMTPKEFLPRWGFGASAVFVMNPTNRDFINLLSLSMKALLPGVVRPHSTTLRLGWQQSVGRPNRGLGFRMKNLVPRGAGYDFTPKRWAAASIDYQLPVWYPEGGWTSVLYFKRLRLNVFGDYARWQSTKDGRWRPLWSYGGDIILEVNPLRMPPSTVVVLKFTIAKPSDRRTPYFGFGFEVPL